MRGGFTLIQPWAGEGGYVDVTELEREPAPPRKPKAPRKKRYSIIDWLEGKDPDDEIYFTETKNNA
jgi:hypothetical protein